jgi:hypothetical protein
MGVSPGRIGRIAMRGAFFPRVLVQLVGFEGGAYHHSRRCRLIDVGLNTLPEGMKLFA